MSRSDYYIEEDMNIITSISVKGLWGTQDLDIEVNKKTNFIIGVNGTGKTTLINLLAAALTLDISKLARIEFTQIEIRLKDVSVNRRPTILVSKIESEFSSVAIKYSIKKTIRDDAITAIFDTDISKFEGLVGFESHRRRIHSNFNYSETKELLNDLIQVSWLSINRSENLYNREFDNKQLSNIDHKIIDLNNNLVRYFSLLSQKFSEHTVEFQKKSFLALINNDGANAILEFSKSIDISKEKNTLIDVFDILGVKSKDYVRKLNDHFSRLEAVKNRNEQRGISVDDFSVLYNTWRVHALIGDYESLQEVKHSIFEHRDNFIKLLNTMFNGRKVFSVSEKNELIVVTKDSRPIGLNELSSGEKQLLIILGETLLQNSKHVIYIADEPELSLHIIWQEQLISAITKLNPNTQIIFATHSPDIVGSEQDSIISMENLIS
ncbi:AAA family ATPase [Providencia sp. PROV269]|uniref:AAA family ATPase n=1 Tax=Providencia sp. PROV269 TaxID=2949957 RepID=UPI00234B242A|nr:AAA family ATPase [Providencia sp. PROV269]